MIQTFAEDNMGILVMAVLFVAIIVCALVVRWLNKQEVSDSGQYAECGICHERLLLAKPHKCK
jgi:hypothetical protein